MTPQERQLVNDLFDGDDRFRQVAMVLVDCGLVQALPVARDGQDTIADFTASGANHDVIELAKALASDFDTVMSHATQVGADTVIAFDASTSITLANLNRSSLTHSDFLFV